METLTTPVAVDVDAIDSFIYESSAVVGWFPFLPLDSTIKALNTLDYGAAVIIPNAEYRDASEEKQEALDDVPSMVSVGGYAFDSLPNASYYDIKRMFNGIVPANENGHLDNVGFLVRLIVQPTGIVATDSIAIDMNTARIYNQSPVTNFDRFRKAHKASSRY